MRNSAAFKASMVKKMTGRRAISANALAKEVGVSQATLSKWKREASRVLDVSTKEPEEVEPRPKKRAQDWTPEEKMQAILDTDGMDGGGLGAYLRRTGLHSDPLEAWRKEAMEGAIQALGGGTNKGKRTQEQRRLRQLEREVRRKDKALAETTALLVLKKVREFVRGRGRRHGPGERRMMLKLIKEARASGARLRPCCETIGIDTRTVRRWQKQGPDGGEDRRQGPKTTRQRRQSLCRVDISDVEISTQLPGQAL